MTSLRPLTNSSIRLGSQAGALLPQQVSEATRPAKVWEQPSECYCPLIASLVTGGSHLLCAMLECAVREMGGHIAAIDTDSAMVVSSKDGGWVRCAGGPHKLEDYRVPTGHDAIWAVSFGDVDCLRERFESLNPWRDSLKTSFLKLEKENFDSMANASSYMPTVYQRSCTACLIWMEMDCSFVNLLDTAGIPAGPLQYCSLGAENKTKVDRRLATLDL